VCVCVCMYKECFRRNLPYFGKTLFNLNYMHISKTFNPNLKFCEDND